eukprot:scaffold2115_cov171-Pinguiococcus_pyrenoidosus.AAC.1
MQRRSVHSRSSEHSSSVCKSLSTFCSVLARHTCTLLADMSCVTPRLSQVLGRRQSMLLESIL